MKFSVSHGFRDDTAAPEIVRKPLAVEAEHGNQGGPRIIVRLHLANATTEESTLRLPSSGVEVFDEFAHVAARLQKPDVQRATLAFFHPAARKAGSATKPEFLSAVASTAHAALSTFLRVVADTLHPDKAWAACDWAILEIVR